MYNVHKSLKVLSSFPFSQLPRVFSPSLCLALISFSCMAPSDFCPASFSVSRLLSHQYQLLDDYFLFDRFIFLPRFTFPESTLIFISPYHLRLTDSWSTFLQAIYPAHNTAVLQSLPTILCLSSHSSSWTSRMYWFRQQKWSIKYHPDPPLLLLSLSLATSIIRACINTDALQYC